MNFQIESTSFCNLTCPECPNWAMERARAMMPTVVFETILDKYVLPFKDRDQRPPVVIMHKDGEPWLNKRLPGFLQAIAKRDPSLKIDIYTHGLLLDQEKIDLLIRLPNPVRMLVSFHFNNHDGTTNDYTKTTELLHRVLSDLADGLEIILVSHLIRPMTQEQLDEWRDSWVSKFPHLTVHTNADINPWTGLIEEPGCYSFKECPYGIFDHMFFGVTGNVIACCVDLEEEIVFGNVMKDDPEEMFNTLQQFYADVSQMKLDHQVCRYCLGVEKRPEGPKASQGVMV